MRTRNSIPGSSLKACNEDKEGILLCFHSFDHNTGSTSTMKGAQSDSLVDSMSKGVRMEKSLNPPKDEST